MPGLKPGPTPVFHITPIVTLESIAREGKVISKNQLKSQCITSANIAYEGIQARRGTKAVGCGPGGTLHDYVPFYFAPRSPMLMAINEGGVANCDFRQGDIVHLVSTAQAINQLGHPFVFSDVHAVLSYARMFDDLARLDEIEWSIFFENPLVDGYCKYWQNRPTPVHVRRKEIRQAEFLVHDYVPVGAVSEIAVYNSQAQSRVNAALVGTGWNPVVTVRPGWYY